MRPPGQPSTGLRPVQTPGRPSSIGDACGLRRHGSVAPSLRSHVALVQAFSPRPFPGLSAALRAPTFTPFPQSYQKDPLKPQTPPSDPRLKPSTAKLAYKSLLPLLLLHKLHTHGSAAVTQTCQPHSLPPGLCTCCAPAWNSLSLDVLCLRPPSWLHASV